MGTVEKLFPRGREERDQHITEISRERKRDERRYTTGLENVDAIAKPMQPGGFVVVGAREGQGKTSYVEQLIVANAWSHRVLFVSLDMPPEIIQDRILSKSMQVGREQLSQMTQENDPQYTRTMKRLSSLDLRVWRPKKGHKRIEHIIEHCEDIEAAILVVDYCRLLDGWEYGKRAADIVDTTVDWTQNSGVTTIFLTQLRDEAVNRRPHNGHIQDTTQLGQRADRVQLIYRPFQGSPRRDVVAEILTTKNRWGPTCQNHVGWTGETMDFYPYTGEEEATARCCYRPK
jgi:replicative DNA helicase